MKNKITLLFLITTLFTAATYAQKPTAESIRKRMSLGFGINNDFWQKIPDSISPRAINQGVDVFFNYAFPMDRKGHLSFFMGAGIGAHNLYHNALLGIGSHNFYGTLPEGVEEDESFFYNVPDVAGKYSVSVKKSKLSITYFDIPFGFRYSATNKIHATLGFKVGWSLNDHTKYKGSSLDGLGYQVKQKELNVKNVRSLHYGPYVVVGYKWIGISAFYQLTSVFEEDLGPQIYPISIGLVFRPN